MIGQNELLNQFKEMIADRTVMFPKFIILVGPKGSGKKTMANEIYKMISESANINVNQYILEDNKVDTVRAMISDANKVIEPTIYVIPDADKMSTSAKNSMLKVTEEPPANAWFILTLENEYNALATIRSRGQVYKLHPYSGARIMDYIKMRFERVSLQETEIMLDICETPGEVEFLYKNGVIALYEYVEKVVENIATVSGSNAFKIGNKIAFKDEEDKYDLRLFWKAFMKVCSDKMRDLKDIKYADAIRITSKYMQQLSTTGVNKSSTFDLFILEIRESWLKLV